MDREHWDAWAKKTLVKLLPANCPEGQGVSQLPREAARWMAWFEPSFAEQFVRSCFAPAGRTSHFAHSCPCFMAGCWAVQCGSNVKQISFDRFAVQTVMFQPVTSCKLSGWVWGHKSSEALMMHYHMIEEAIRFRFLCAAWPCWRLERSCVKLASRVWHSPLFGCWGRTGQIFKWRTDEDRALVVSFELWKYVGQKICGKSWGTQKRYCSACSCCTWWPCSRPMPPVWQAKVDANAMK